MLLNACGGDPYILDKGCRERAAGSRRYIRRNPAALFSERERGSLWIWKPLLAALSQFPLSISKESQRTQIAFPSASGGIRWKKVIVVVASSSPLSS